MTDDRRTAPPKHLINLPALPDLTHGLEVTFHEPLLPPHQRLMDVLGVRVTVDPVRPADAEGEA